MSTIFVAIRLLETAGALGCRVPVGGEAHQLVLAGVDPEAEVVGERRVEQADRVREAQLAQDLDAVAPAVADRRGRPLADAVDRQDRRLLEGRGVERARGVREVVLGEEQFHLVDLVAREPREFLEQQPLEEQLLLDPDRHRGEEGAQAAGRERVVGLEQPLELEEGLVVEGDRLQLLEGGARGVETVADGVRGERGVVLAARETLFLRRRDDLAAVDQRRRGVVVKG